MTNPKVTWQLLKRYIAGEATYLENETVDIWLAEADLEDIRLVFADLTRRYPAEEMAYARAWARLLLPRTVTPISEDWREPVSARSSPPPASDELPAMNIGVSPRHLPQPIGPSARHTGLPRHVPRSLAAAAAVALVLGGSFLAWQLGRSPERRGLAAASGTVAAPVGRPPVPILLPDGSRIVVGPGSTLRYAAAFGADRREVELTGEAYFQVQHDARRPFLVRAGDLVAEDLGTEFVVRAYPEDRHGRVIVRQGSVGVGGAVVAPGQLGRRDSSGAVVIEAADTASWFGWTSGDLVFAHMRLQEALPQLSRWYGVEFRLANPSLGALDLTGRLHAHLDLALDELQNALGRRLTREGRVVIVYADSAKP